MGNSGSHLPLDVLAGSLQLALYVDVAGCQEDVNPRTLGIPDRLEGRLDVLLGGSCQPADDGVGGAQVSTCDGLNGLEVTRRCDRETRLDHIDPQPRELLGDLQLFLLVQRDARRLLAVAQRRVEYQHAVGLIATASDLSIGNAHVTTAPSISRLRSPAAGFAATRPPRAIPPGGGAGEAREKECAASALTVAARRRSGNARAPVKRSGQEHDLADVAPLADHPMRVIGMLK